MNLLQKLLGEGVETLVHLAPTTFRFRDHLVRGVMQQAPLDGSRMLEEGYRHELMFTLHVAASALPPEPINLRAVLESTDPEDAQPEGTEPERYEVTSLTRSEGFIKYTLRRIE